MSDRTLLIDGDILVVSTAAALETEIDWGDDLWTLHCDLGHLEDKILGAIERLKEDLEATSAVVCLSRGDTFRHALAPTYKAGRGRKPIGVAEMKRRLIEEHGAKLKPGVEADDTMGILATHPYLIPGETVIVSQDKDMLTIPGLLYRDGEIVEVSEIDADLAWMTQTLTGDPTDGYPGCPGIGPVKAAKVLNKAVEAFRGMSEETFASHMAFLWPAVVEAYEKAGLTEDDALLQARLARILRHADYNFKTNEVILWKPAT